MGSSAASNRLEAVIWCKQIICCRQTHPHPHTEGGCTCVPLPSPSHLPPLFLLSRSCVCSFTTLPLRSSINFLVSFSLAGDSLSHLALSIAFPFRLRLFFPFLAVPCPSSFLLFPLHSAPSLITSPAAITSQDSGRIFLIDLSIRGCINPPVNVISGISWRLE